MSATTDYHERAQRHAPKTIDEARAAAHQMLAEGHSAYGIASALGLAIEQVRRLLGCADCES